MATTEETKASRGLRKEREGVVVSDKMAKTIVVKVTRLVKHPKYGKFIRRDSKYYAHDEGGQAKLGDLVRIVQTRPMSRLKRWRLAQVVQKAS
ncbi:MAG: 30S ribosomal protein S17 [Bdellovibrionota bacterium]|nr:MAG: 30S ribosomal protein S17 [Bdellovibrionota bacterium]